MRPSILSACLWLLLIAAGPLQAQQRISSFLMRPEPGRQVYGVTAPYADTTEPTSLNAPLKPEKSGSLAMLLSAVLPGAGQIYAERYYTIPLIWGFGAYFVSQWVKLDQKYRDYREQFIVSVRADSLQHQGITQLRDIRDFYHDQRDEFAIYIALTYILNIIDAYVGATLYGFEVSDNLGSASIRFRIPLR
jgi:hypothetical protein